MRPGFFGRKGVIDYPDTNEGKLALLREFASTWAEPFRSLVYHLREDSIVKQLDLYDWTPPKDLKGHGRVALMGDAFHPMAMCQ